MKKLQLLLLAMAAINSHAQEAAIYTGTLDCYRSVETGERPEMRMPKLKCVTANPQKADSEDDEAIYRDVTVSGAGELAAKLGEDVNNIDSLVVRGPIGLTDFDTMWSASFHGCLSVINLKFAEVEGGVIPDYAFYNHNEQYGHSTEGDIQCINLRRIILPESVTLIGAWAFAYAINLEKINIPNSLQQIGNCTFYNCHRLKTDPLVFPEGFKKIGKSAFYECSRMEGNVVFPSTLREIDNAAFFMTNISSITIPEGLERLGRQGFYGSKLKTVKIPDTCKEIGEDAFRWNLELECATLPEGILRIPAGIFYVCLKLQEVNLPSTVNLIGEEAFGCCESIKSLTLPQGLEYIEAEAFNGMTALEQISFPASLKSLGQKSCNWPNIKRIYCAAIEPPVCQPSAEGYPPFGAGTPTNTPVYVPVGSVDKYRNAKGWGYFSNFIETDQFPGQASVTETLVDKTSDSGILYDLMGRRVEKPVKGQIYIKNGRKLIHN